VELRTLKAVTVAGFAFPHAAQVIQVIGKTRELRTRRWRNVTVDAITSLTFAQASPDRLADLIRIGALSRAGPVYLATALRPRRHPAAHHPRNHLWMKRTLRENDGALGSPEARLAYCPARCAQTKSWIPCDRISPCNNVG
jgi:hypothetical protein